MVSILSMAFCLAIFFSAFVATPFTFPLFATRFVAFGFLSPLPPPINTKAHRFRLESSSILTVKLKHTSEQKLLKVGEGSLEQQHKYQRYCKCYRCDSDK